MFERQQIADRMLAQAEMCEIAAALCSAKIFARKKYILGRGRKRIGLKRKSIWLKLLKRVI